MSEERIQAECFQWFWNNYPALRRTMFAVPNGGRRVLNEASRMKATGTVPGVSDLVWVLPNRIIFIEMKNEVGVQSPEQKDFEQKMKDRRHTYVILRSFEQFKTFIKDNI